MTLAISAKTQLLRHSRRNFTDVAIFPDDHRQTAATKLDPLFASGASMRFRCDASFRRHLAFGISFNTRHCFFIR
jgi:hypothetical protein